MSFPLLLGIVWIISTLAIITIATVLAKRLGYSVLVGLYAAMSIAATVTATKLVNLLGFNVTASIIIFASTFLITDILAEFYGRKTAETAVYVGFVSVLIYALHSLITVYWPAVSYWGNQEAYATIIGQSARVGIAGPIAFFVSQLNDVFIFDLIKRRTNGRHLWLRNNVSTMISQLIDTVIFMVIAFAGVYPLWPLILGTWIVKVVISAADTPFIYIARRILTGSWKRNSEIEKSLQATAIETV